ncbi:MAG: diguanylate cyclase [Leptolyngbyaceae cyanobacterium MO_188.B28]|nr:diguanylate cyclase [Leptolyngbyaceae cyanobacterium MO_188.B28]
MTTIGAFLLNIVLYSVFPLYFTTINTRLRTVGFYIYISIVLVLGGLAGAVYSFPLTETLHISGGNLAYGAFMMSTVMLIIIERDVTTFQNMIRLVVMIDLFVFLGFNFLAWLLESEQVLNPLHVPAVVFRVSLWVLILGGVLILGEILILLFIFLKVRKLTSNISALAFIYTLAFVLILCMDGFLFPLLAFGLSSDLVSIVFGNVLGKMIIASCYSLPMLGFYFVFQRNFIRFLDAPLTINELVSAPRKKLLETLYYYEIRNRQLQRDKQELAEIAGCDGLTDLANRRRFEQTIEVEWSRCQRNACAMTLVIGDIDYFKQYNDSYGHQQGDVCLRKIAALWGNIFNRPSDLTARIGGEEFAIILPDTHLKQILPNLQRFLVVLQEQPIPHRASSIASHVTMSIGVADCMPQNSSSWQELFAVADQRLYAAKHDGRNRIVSE